MSGTDVSKSYQATSLDEQQAAYDDWAARYERDLMAMGYRLPALLAGLFARHVVPGTAPILDAGCGGGLQAEALAVLGYGPIVGLDLSEGMLAVARAKGIYAELRQGVLGEPLDFPDDHFGAVLSIGTITPRHAPPEALDELIRVARPGAPLLFSLRDDPAQEPQYPAHVEALSARGVWRHVASTPSVQSMPWGEPEVTHRIHVYEVV